MLLFLFSTSICNKNNCSLQHHNDHFTVATDLLGKNKANLCHIQETPKSKVYSRHPEIIHPNLTEVCLVFMIKQYMNLLCQVLHVNTLTFSHGLLRMVDNSWGLIIPHMYPLAFSSMGTSYPAAVALVLATAAAMATNGDHKNKVWLLSHPQRLC